MTFFIYLFIYHVNMLTFLLFFVNPTWQFFRILIFLVLNCLCVRHHETAFVKSSLQINSQ